MLRLGLGPQIASNTPSENSLDPDAQAYFTTAGVTDYTAKIQISDFVKGVKNLGLYGSMVCWPLRSSQNAGTGTTAYSLGGLGTYNMTLTGGPTWNANGITTDVNNDYATASIPATVNFTGMSIMARTSTSDSGSFPTYWHYSKKTNSPNDWFFNFLSYLNDGGLGIYAEMANIAWSPARASGKTSTDFGFQSASMNSASQAYATSLDGTFITRTRAAGFSENLVEIVLGARWAGAAGYNVFSQGTHSAFLHFNTPLNSTSIESIRSLYKTTLGQGLGLP